MKILYPKPITIIESAAITEGENYPRWTAGTYIAGAKVIREVAVDSAAIDAQALDFIFEAAVDTSADPASGSLDWLNRGASPAHRAFDESVSTLSAYARDDALEISAGRIDGIFLSRFNGAAKLEVFDAGSDTPFFTRSLNSAANYSQASNWTTYFFRDILNIAASQDMVVEVVSRIAGVRVRLTALTGGYSLGKIIVGSALTLGETKIAPSIGILDFSIKATDDNGNTYLKAGQFAKRGSFDLLIETSQFDFVAQLLAAMRARPIVWLADDIARFSSLIIYGSYKDFDVILSGDIYCECNLIIEGLT